MTVNYSQPNSDGDVIVTATEKSEEVQLHFNAQNLQPASSEERSAAREADPEATYVFKMPAQGNEHLLT